MNLDFVQLGIVEGMKKHGSLNSALLGTLAGGLGGLGYDYLQTPEVDENGQPKSKTLSRILTGAGIGGVGGMVLPGIANALSGQEMLAKAKSEAEKIQGQSAATQSATAAAKAQAEALIASAKSQAERARAAMHLSKDKVQAIVENATNEAKDNYNVTDKSEAASALTGATIGGGAAANWHYLPNWLNRRKFLKETESAWNLLTPAQRPAPNLADWRFSLPGPTVHPGITLGKNKKTLAAALAALVGGASGVYANNIFGR